MNTRILFLFYTYITLFLSASICAQTPDAGKKKKNGSLYFSWGYNQEWYTRSTVHITQPGLGNEYDLVQVHGHDHMGWNNKSVFKQALTIPQYNYRIGYYFNKKQDLALEINFDHTKFIIANNQHIRLKGVLRGTATDEDIFFSENNGFYYFLNNGANFFLLNLVKRISLYTEKNNNFSLGLICKAGAGPVIPHVENKLFGVQNDPHFQFGGWNTGVETALRLTVMRYGFLEFSQKADYARYSNLKVASGTARQHFGTYELILSAGFIIPTAKNNPLFRKGSVVKK